MSAASELNADVTALARFSATNDGVTRPAWSDELFAAYEWLAGRGREAGLEPRIDAAGNLRLEGHLGTGERIVAGSHVDTVPHGGRYDGALGVLSGLDAARALAREGESRLPLSVIAFMDEEGTRFGTALFGSQAFAGADLSALGGRTDGDGIALADAMAARGYPFGELAAARGVDDVAAYLELHVEQGPVLEHEGIDIGVVTSIVGLLALEARMTGEANHAGTTPMRLRRDALAGAARAIGELRDLARAGSEVTANVGTIAVEPGGKNVVPGVCTFTIDVRAATRRRFAALDADVRGIVGRIAEEEGLALEVSELYRLEPAELDAGLVDVVELAADLEGASTLRMPSGAGHDAMMIAPQRPSAMVFVPSRRGISHSPQEHTSPEHCELGARVLAQAVRLAAR